MTNQLALTPLEIASGYVFGTDPTAPRLPPPGNASTALERCVRRALLREPCLVTFSGGVDSSAVLALAVHIARRDGLPPPIPLTYRFPGRRASDETAWQELIIAKLQIEDWMRPAFDAELDCLGPLATSLLVRHGLLSPPNAHFVVPALEAAGSGAVLTGHGGDELLQPGGRARLARVLARHEVPVPRDAARLLAAMAPARLRARRRQGEADRIVHAPWLRATAHRRVVETLALEIAREPVRPRQRIQHSWQMRSNQLTLRSFELLARDHNAELIHPFEERAVVSALAEWAQARQPISRAETLRELLGDIVPREILGRRTKATFDGAFWARHSRDFAFSLAPEEVDSDLVDGKQAIEYWTANGGEPFAPVASSSLLQHAWLERRSNSAVGGGEDRIGRRV